MADIKKDLQGVYNSISHDFSNTRAIPWEELAVFLPQLKDGAQILDLGCGNGRLLKVLEQSGKPYNYLGVDFSQELVKEAKQKFPTREFMVADMSQLDFPEKSFDAICLIASFHHLSDKKERLDLLKKIHFWLKPGGVLFMTNWYLWQNKYLKYFFKNFSQKRSLNDFFIPYKLPNSQKVYWRYYHHFTQRELKQLLLASGFQPNERSVYRSKFNTNCLVVK